MDVDLARDGAVAKRRAVKFERLRLDGFKSFPDRTEILIEPGLTGVVGPNGCGKSNLLEAMRWAMGETSARRMRGSSMDDVIFGGSEGRTPRNVAEVSIELDNRSRGAPSEFNDADVLEVSRRIERGQGTKYRVNGKDARQRDVQILFQDNAAGATSPAIVSQGRVAALIAAKPSERRVVLEEAAGVSGLTARRHETSLRIRATEDNIARADDALVAATDTLSVLRRQARQAARRREIDARVREALALVLHIKHVEAGVAEERARSEHETNERRVAQAMLDATGSAKLRDEAAAALGPVREERTRAEAALARAQARLESAASDVERAKRALEEARRRIVEAGADKQRTDVEIVESERKLGQVKAERAELAAARTGEGAALEAASDALEEAKAKLVEADRLHAAAAGELAGSQAARDAATKARDEASRRVEIVTRRLEEVEKRLAAAVAASSGAEAVAAARDASRGAEDKVEAAGFALEGAERELQDAQEGEATASTGFEESRVSLTSLEAERQGLAAVKLDTRSKRPVSDMLTVEPGYEVAVAAALGESGLAGLDVAESAWWSAPPVVNVLWDGRTLADVAKGVDELRGFLASVAICEDEALEGAAAAGLPPGCSLVGMRGGFLRWDGYRSRAVGGEVEAALLRATRLRQVEADIVVAREAADRARAAVEAARGRLSAARMAEAAARAASRAAYEEAKATRETTARLEREHEESARRLAVAESETAAARSEKHEALAVLGERSGALHDIPDDAGAKAALEEARKGVSAAREAEAAGRIRVERLMGEAAARRQRFDACVKEEAAWSERWEAAKERREDLAYRAEAAERALEEAETSAQEADGGAVEVAKEAFKEAETVVNCARAAEAKGEADRLDLENQVRIKEAAVSALREERARLLANVEMAQRGRQAASSDIEAQLDCRPENALAAAALKDGEVIPDVSTATARHARLERERDSLGMVNFLAEQELVEQETRFGEMEKARAELKETVQRLGKALREIEDEARDRLSSAFAVIDGHFSELFAKLFEGGQSHLRLVGSEDVLEAGLEIYASPPGKRMQVLSLLSGGEQALTAMALIFAAFLSNPAPICVCDEVDAALDDANTDRLVRLMETMARNDNTRFLCITHSPLTMARMNRLYGVTMMERGVSSVTKVDLDRAIEIVDS